MGVVGNGSSFLGVCIVADWNIAHIRSYSSKQFGWLHQHCLFTCWLDNRHTSLSVDTSSHAHARCCQTNVSVERVFSTSEGGSAPKVTALLKTRRTCRSSRLVGVLKQTVTKSVVATQPLTESSTLGVYVRDLTVIIQISLLPQQLHTWCVPKQPCKQTGTTTLKVDGGLIVRWTGRHVQFSSVNVMTWRKNEFVWSQVQYSTGSAISWGHDPWPPWWNVRHPWVIQEM